VSGKTKRAGVIAGAAAAAALVWTILDRVAGIDPAVRSGDTVRHIGVVAVAITALVSGVAGMRLLYWLKRHARRPRRTWTTIAVAVLVLSLLGPLGGTSIGAKIGLAVLHLTVAAILIVGLPAVEADALAAGPPPVRPSPDAVAATRRTADTAGGRR
jgi:Family of unknown function (DUF6069)